jgi:predicted DNA-binding transcriptional regulator AlpA
MNTAEAVETKRTQEGLLCDFMSEDDLARDLDVAKKTLHRWSKEGRGPRRTKIGRRVLYRRDSVREWLQACERDPHQRDRRFGLRPRAQKRRA